MMECFCLCYNLISKDWALLPLYIFGLLLCGSKMIEIDTLAGYATSHLRFG